MKAEVRGRPPSCNHPALPWVILATVAIMAFLGGALLVLLGSFLFTALLNRPFPNPLSSSFLMSVLERLDSFLENPWLLTLMIAGGVTATLWATRIAWRTLEENKTRPEESTPPGRVGT